MTLNNMQLQMSSEVAIRSPSKTDLMHQVFAEPRTAKFNTLIKIRLVNLDFAGLVNGGDHQAAVFNAKHGVADQGRS
ncbi:unnamed protein product [Macrosiphum euphorbiae]|uniref:Uncharacterized protein n=1 Tax=Macrosiphum euphorbiae TaxID=13131 RepID=A0AAV0VVV6_9HEMI|nr:unnamed protein product [Macrosiphum euphorbiae]